MEITGPRAAPAAPQAEGRSDRDAVRIEAEGWSTAPGDLAGTGLATRFVASCAGLTLDRRGSGGTFITLPVADIRSIEALAAPAGGQLTVAILLRNGGRVTGTWPDSFTAPAMAALSSGVDHSTAASPSAAATTTALPPALATTPSPPAISGVPERPSRRRQVLAAVGATVLVAALVIVYVGLHQRGTGWQRRAEKAERTVTELTQQRDALDRDLANVRRDLATSQARAADLDRRVGELSTEKGQVQDERNHWMEVSTLGAESVTAMQQCMSDISTAIDGLLDRYTSVSAYRAQTARAEASCRDAGSKVAAFAGAYEAR